MKAIQAANQLGPQPETSFTAASDPLGGYCLSKAWHSPARQHWDQPLCPCAAVAETGGAMLRRPWRTSCKTSTSSFSCPVPVRRHHAYALLLLCGLTVIIHRFETTSNVHAEDAPEVTEQAAIRSAVGEAARQPGMSFSWPR